MTQKGAMRSAIFGRIILTLIISTASIAAEESEFYTIRGSDDPQLIENYQAFISLAGTLNSLQGRNDAGPNEFLNQFLDTEDVDYLLLLQLFDDFLVYKDIVENDEITKVCEKAQTEINFLDRDFIFNLQEADRETERRVTQYIEENLGLILRDSDYSNFINKLEGFKSSITIRKTTPGEEALNNISRELLLNTYCQ